MTVESEVKGRELPVGECLHPMIGQWYVVLFMVVGVVCLGGRRDMPAKDGSIDCGGVSVAVDE